MTSRPKRRTRAAASSTLPATTASLSSTPSSPIIAPPRLTGRTLAGQVPAGHQARMLALHIDGHMVAATAVRPDGAFEAELPHHVIGLELELFDIDTGSPLLAAPLDVSGALGVEWLGWSCRAGVIEGAFRLGSADHPPDRTAVLPVQASARGAAFYQAYAQPDESGIHRFAAPVRRLLPVGETLRLMPVVGGLEIDAPLSVSAQEIGIIGYVNTDGANAVQGGAARIDDPDACIEVELRIDGHSVGRVRADLLREDVKALGLSDGLSGFRLAFPPGVPRARPVQIEVVVAGTDIQLCDSPFERPALPRFAGYFDALEGPFAGGWAVDMEDPATPLRVEAVCDGQVIGTGLANLYRGDVEKAGLPTPWCGFRFLLQRPIPELLNRDIWLRVQGTDEVLEGSPRLISQNANIERFLLRATTLRPEVLRRLSQRWTAETAGVRISIVMPVYNPKRAWLIEALNSVLGQWSGNWELICVDDGSTEPHVKEVLEAAARADPRIRAMRAPRNMGIARATNFGLRAARGNFVAFMDHDDVIEPDAVHKLAQAALQTGADLIYSDEAITTDDINSIVEVRARPAFSHDFYMSHPYFVHMIAVRTALALQLGGWDESLPICADVDFVLRAIERAGIVAHVPRVLYRWRTHDSSTGHQKQELVTKTMLGALDRHLARLGLAATAAPGHRYNEYRLDWADDGGEILIVIPTKNRVDLLKVAIDSIEKTGAGANYRIVVIDHESTDKKTIKYLASISGRHTVMPYSGVFNYARMNNAAVNQHGTKAKYILLLNNDVEAIQPGWLQRLRSLAARRDVGAVGPLLLYGDDRIQHAGVLVGFSGAADHAMKFQDCYITEGNRHPGYNCNLTSVRDFSAVTAACMMVRHDVFRKVRGFDEKFVVGFNDTDLCLRIGAAGYKVLYDGFTVLYHHESATRTQSKEVDHPEDDLRLRTRWTQFFTHGDPFYSPLLAPRGTDHTLRKDEGCKGRMAPRARAVAAPSHPATRAG